MAESQDGATCNADGRRLASLAAYSIRRRLVSEYLVASSPNVYRRVPQRKNGAEAGGGAVA